MSAIYVHRKTANKYIMMSGKKDMMSGKNILIEGKNCMAK
jgi:hypothetical protein